MPDKSEHVNSRVAPIFYNNLGSFVVGVILLFITFVSDGSKEKAKTDKELNEKVADLTVNVATLIVQVQILTTAFNKDSNNNYSSSDARRDFENNQRQIDEVKARVSKLESKY